MIEPEQSELVRTVPRSPHRPPKRSDRPFEGAGLRHLWGGYLDPAEDESYDSCYVTITR